MNVIAVDWGKHIRKRSAYLAMESTRSVSRHSFDGSLAQLIECAENLDPPTLIGIDAAIGYPIQAWHRLMEGKPAADTTFVDFLLQSTLPDGFFAPVRAPEEWSPSRPFIQPPAGSWSLNAFIEASHDGLHRQVDRQLDAKPLFVTSGMPGTVGSGTRALWQELRALKDPSAIRIWPFHGPLEKLVLTGKPILAEIYPKACYGIALADSLPAPLMSIAKTKPHAREVAIAQLLKASWVADYKVSIQDARQAMASEDDFDALFSAAALLRLFLTGAPIEKSATENLDIEGDAFGSGSITADRSQIRPSRPRPRAKMKPENMGHGQQYPCPIPGCDHIFHSSRGGWDAHVASLKRHAEWHPEERNPSERKRLFRAEFADWFFD